VQGRYDDEPEELGLDRTAWCPMQQTLAPCRAASTTSPPDSAAAGPGDGDDVGSPCSREARSALPLDPQLLEMLPFGGLRGLRPPYRGLGLSFWSCLDAPQELPSASCRPSYRSSFGTDQAGCSAGVIGSRVSIALLSLISE
jgi:hypothetical protein